MRQIQSNQVRPIRIFHDSLKVADLLFHNFQGTPAIANIDFPHTLRLLRNAPNRIILCSLHHIVSGSVEAFVWAKNNNIMGVGVVQRLPNVDGTTWLLTSFAVNRKSINLEAFANMNKLVCKAINHARKHGASFVEAYVRADNFAPLLLCKRLGFTEICQYSCFEISITQKKALCAEKKDIPRIRITPVRNRLLNRMFWVLSQKILGHRTSIYNVFFEGQNIAQITITVFSGDSSSCQVLVNPSEDFSPGIASYLIDAILRIGSNLKNTTIIVTPTSCQPLVATFQQNQIQNIYNIKLLRLNMPIIVLTSSLYPGLALNQRPE